ncbi:MAG TPA: VOC family protein [Prosthecobacter sp.]|nr:VOC family protein [Prosthecobacter sp.]
MSLPLVEAYLDFNGRCEEALEFYKKALDAKVDAMMRFSDAPPSDEPSAEGCGGPPSDPNKIMHSVFRIGDYQVMASDCRCEGQPKFQGFSLTLGLATEAEADKYFNALAEGGKVEMPLSKTFWSPRFGVVSDRFGLSWMINVHPAAEK